MPDQPVSLQQLHLGPDEIQLDRHGMTIRSRVDMPDWELREYRQAQIVFRDRSYYLTSKRREGRHTLYQLKPWHERLGLPGYRIIYDETYVARRDKAVRRHRRRQLSEPLAMMVLPLLGFLSAKQKQVLEREAGIDAYSATRGSLMLEFGALAVLAVFHLISLWVEVYGAGLFNRSTLLMLMAVLIPDLIIRWSYALEDGPYLGFYEWPLYWLRRR